LGKHPLSGKTTLTEIFETLEKFRATRLDHRGRIYIPKVVRERLQLKLGDRIYIKIENDHFKVYSTEGIKKRSTLT
jgi:AbrB family looped-hinge helix DNA binding protein